MTPEDPSEQAWEARADGRPCTVTVAADGLRITRTDSEETTRYAWADLQGVSFPDGFTVELRPTSGVTVALTFHAGVTQRELRAALDGKVAVAAADPRPGSAPLDLDAVPPRRSPGGQPLSTTFLVCLGVLVSAVAGVVIGRASGSDSTGLLLLGYAAAVLGSVVLGVGVIGLGVRLGLEEHAWRNPRRRT